MVYVDLPNTSDLSGPMVTVGRFRTKAEAVAWVRENIGYCDDDGRICLLTETEEAPTEREQLAQLVDKLVRE
jgi:hypothetical protein